MKQNGNSSNIAVVNCKQHACIIHVSWNREKRKQTCQTNCQANFNITRTHLATFHSWTQRREREVKSGSCKDQSFGSHLVAPDSFDVLCSWRRHKTRHCQVGNCVCLPMCGYKTYETEKLLHFISAPMWKYGSKHITMHIFIIALVAQVHQPRL